MPDQPLRELESTPCLGVSWRLLTGCQQSLEPARSHPSRGSAESTARPRASTVGVVAAAGARLEAASVTAHGARLYETTGTMATIRRCEQLGDVVKPRPEVLCPRSAAGRRDPGHRVGSRSRNGAAPAATRHGRSSELCEATRRPGGRGRSPSAVSSPPTLSLGVDSNVTPPCARCSPRRAQAEQERRAWDPPASTHKDPRPALATTHVAMLSPDIQPDDVGTTEVLAASADAIDLQSRGLGRRPRHEGSAAPPM